MRLITRAIAFLLPLVPAAISPQATPNAETERPIKTTVCNILQHPAAFNNKLVQVRGSVTVSFEYSILYSESGEPCSGGEGIWFALADGSGPPGLTATINGHGVAGEKDSDGHWKLPTPVELNRDANFEEFEDYLNASAKVQPGRPCGADCHRYKVTATFTGRIDAVSDKVHAVHLKRSRSESSDFKGFGQMGLFDAQLVLQSVKEVEAVDLAHPTVPKSP